MRTVDQIIAEQKVFTPEQRSLAWSPEPAKEAGFACDCRPGGGCGLDLNRESRWSQWMLARMRWVREQKWMERSAA